MIIGINARFLAAPVSGVQRFGRELAARLIDGGDVVVFTPRGVDPPHAWGSATLVGGRLRGHAWEQIELPRLARQRCDVLLNPANTGPLTGPPRVLVLHDVFPLVQPAWYAPAFAAWYRALVPAAASRAARVATTTAAAAQRIAGVLRLPQHRIDIVPQGIAPLDRPAPADMVTAVLRQLGVPQPCVLATGHGDARKNVGFAIDVVRRCNAMHGTRLTLVVTGAAPVRVFGRSAPATVRQEGSDLIAVGHVSDEALRALYTGAAAVLCPAHDEGFGRVPLEAMCCGTPALVADHAAARETLGRSPAHRLPPDVARWAAALHHVVHTDECVAPAAAEQLRTRWSWERAAAGIRASCAAALDSCRPRAEVA